MKTLVWVEHDGSAVKDATLAAVTAASKLGEVHLLVAGEGVGGVASAAAQIAGVQKVHVADNAAFGHNLPENIAPLVAELMASHDAFVAPATTTGKNIAPRVAALLDVMQISEVTKVVSADTFERPIYAGNAIQTVKSSDKVKVFTVRTAATCVYAKEPLPQGTGSLYGIIDYFAGKYTLRVTNREAEFSGTAAHSAATRPTAGRPARTTRTTRAGVTAATPPTAYP